jgi:hypothetical protein
LAWLGIGVEETTDGIDILASIIHRLSPVPDQQNAGLRRPILALD